MLTHGYGPKISPENDARLKLGLQTARDLAPAFEAELRKLTVPELKAMISKFRTITPEMKTKQHFIDVMMSWHAGECLKQAGYKRED